ncbi:MAG TPA: histidine phosphatase family protein [Anaerolineales bacterium]|nr:histidine phosphatase family protein [Anaerolineales bacterium]
MKTLLLLRHAKSSWKKPNMPDHERPLNKRGKKEAPQAGKYLQANQLVPDLILSSTARRAQDTAQTVAETSGFSGQVELYQDLYLSDTASYLDILRCMPDQANRVLVVGHNPDVEELLALLTDVKEHMTTAALAVIDLPISSWQELSEATDGRLQNLWTPQSD